MFSAAMGDGLLELLRKLFLRHPTTEDVFLYKEIRSINTSVGKAIHDFFSLQNFCFEFPSKLLGFSSIETNKIRSTLRPSTDLSTNAIYISKGVGLNIVELISEHCLSLHPSDIHKVPNNNYHNGNDKIYDGFSSGKLFEIICTEIHTKYGAGITPICIGLGFDATDITSGGGSQAKSATPFYFRLLNLSNKVFSLQANTILAGFAPQLTVSFYFIHFFKDISIFKIFYGDLHYIYLQFLYFSI